MSQITQVLDRMPRSMLLILKTNDLLRAIERRLRSHYRADAFLEVCCVQSHLIHFPFLDDQVLQSYDLRAQTQAHNKSNQALSNHCSILLDYVQDLCLSNLANLRRLVSERGERSFKY